ncbi:MAG TPA: hypothetical protein VFE30_11565 [Anaeromyxobacteraceae bacterium]|jgi:hypothetical protein|nr:hypothetical protein [Anaeromyxobacteraceae bacterium]
MRLTAVAACLAVFVATAPLHAFARDLAPGRWGSYSVELLDEAGRVLPTYDHGGRTYVLGALGGRYMIRVANGSPRRLEVVVSVDGRDVLDGRPAEWGKRGYLVEPHGAVTIDGYRLTQEAVAAFRFSSVPRSYAALEGNARDVGVIGVAVFPEREVALAPRPDARALRSEAAPAAPGMAGAKAMRRNGLGTEFGEERASHVEQVPFERARARPDVVLSLRYDDREGLLAAGVPLEPRRCGEQALRHDADPFRRDVGYAAPPPGWRGASARD